MRSRGGSNEVRGDQMFWCKNVNPHIVCLLARVPPLPPSLRLRLDLNTGPPPPLLWGHRHTCPGHQIPRACVYVRASGGCWIRRGLEGPEEHTNSSSHVDGCTNSGSHIDDTRTVVRMSVFYLLLPFCPLGLISTSSAPHQHLIRSCQTTQSTGYPQDNHPRFRAI